MMSSDFGERLKIARERAGHESAAEAARRMNMSPSTYQSHENGNRGNIAKGSAEKYAEFFRVDLKWLLTGKGTIDAKTSGPDVQAGNHDNLDQRVQIPVVRMPVRGEVRAGAWLEFEDLQDRYGADPDKFIPVAKKERYKEVSQFALKVVGNSMNRLAKDGEFVIVAKWDELGREEPIEGEVLVIQRERAMTYEITLKRVRKGASGWELWPESDDPRHQDPIAWLERKGGAEVKVVGKVIGYYRDQD